MIYNEKHSSAPTAGQKQQKIAATLDPVPPRPNGSATPTAAGEIAQMIPNRP